MGLTLRNLANKIGDVAGGIERQVNPFDNGATYSNPQGNGQQLSVAQQIERPVANFVQQKVAQPAVQEYQGFMGSPVANAVRFGIAKLTDNPIAANNASDATKTSFGNTFKSAGTPQPTAQYVNGRIVLNPQKVNTITSLASGMGETLKTPGEIPLDKAAPKEVSTPKPVAQPTARPKVTAKQPNLNPGAFSKEDQAYLTQQLNAEDKANLAPEQQMKLAELEGKQPTTPLAPAEVNTAANPYKSRVTSVEPGNYGHAIQNSQLVSRPIETAQGVWANAMKNLAPEERANFWRAVEKPEGDYSPQLKNAINLWRAVDNKIHGESQALGGNTNFLTDHALHPWQLPEEYTQHIINGGSPGEFTGLNNISRKYRTIEEGEANGLTLGNDPVGEGSRYLQANAAILRKQALKKGLAEADVNQTSKPYSLDLGGGHTVQLSTKGFSATKGVQIKPPSTNIAMKGIRTVNAGLKSTILSLGQFHTINIGALRAAPTLIAEGHPIAAAHGLYGMFRAAFGRSYADNVIGKALADGTVDKAAQIGMPYGGSSYDVSGTFLKHGIGNRTVFGKQIPVMHDKVARSIISDLEKKGIPLDSPRARDAGLAGANMMGELNKELENISPRTQRFMTDTMLAGQFTPSKFIQMKRAVSKGSVGGSYARRNVLSNVAASTLVIAGLGYTLKQKSDDLKDMLLRAIVDPSVPTPLKDSKGNTVKLKLPGTDTSDVAKLLGIKLVREPNGHLGISWNPKNIPSTVGDFGRARLSPLLSDGVKLLTNSTYANKPLYDPNAPAGTKAIQAATSIATGSLPIGLQGVAQTNAVEKHLPEASQEVLDAQKPGTNPVVKSAASSFGLSPATDTTTGKGLETTRYFDAVGENGKGLDRQSKDAYDLWTGSKKNPVTGKYDVQPNINDARAKATALLQNPKAFDSIYNLNQTMAKEKQSVDPLWNLSKDQIKSYLQYQAMPPGGPDKTDWYNKNQSWYAPLIDQRNAFFDALPPGDPNKPKLDIQYPSATPQVTDLMNQYSSLTDSTQKADFLDAHPDLIKQWNAQADYTNKLRDALGYSPLKNYPEASDTVQKFMDTYNAADKATRKAIRTSNPQGYQSMIGYFDSLDLYNIGKQASVSQLKGEPDYTSKEAKAVASLAKDIYINPDGTYQVAPAGWMQGLTSAISGGNGSKTGYTSNRVSFSKAKLLATGKYMVDSDAGGGRKVARLKAGKRPSVKKAANSGPKVATMVSGKPRVSTKRSLV